MVDAASVGSKGGEVIENECNEPINLNDYDVEIVNEFPEEVAKILSERSAILKNALFHHPLKEFFQNIIGLWNVIKMNISAVCGNTTRK